MPSRSTEAYLVLVKGGIGLVRLADDGAEALEVIRLGIVSIPPCLGGFPGGSPQTPGLASLEVVQKY